MNRPNKKDYEFSEKTIRTMLIDFQIPSYLKDLEKYCDELEEKLGDTFNHHLEELLDIKDKRIKELETDYETKQELEQYKKGINRACEMLEILEHAHRENLTREPLTQEQWKEYLLKDE